MRIRTEYSTGMVYGKLKNVFKKCLEFECEYMSITDRYSTYGFVEWAELCLEHKRKPIFGVELGVSPNSGDKRPHTSYWTFLAIDDIIKINELVALATRQPNAMLTYEQANNVAGVITIVDNRAKLDLVNKENVWIALSPSTPIGYYNEARKLGLQFVASSDNAFPAESDRETYRVLLGRLSGNQTYAQHIMSMQEWDTSVSHFEMQDRIDAIYNRENLEKHCTASLNMATLPKIDAPQNLWDLCMAGMVRLGVPFEEPYKSRMIHELKTIADKHFEDYFYIVSELMLWARERMIVAPGRGSSAGSLVCYLLGITSVDPIKYNLLFDRFLDITRKDLPDIDMDFDDKLRHQVFEHLEAVYGKERIAKLANVTRFRPKTIINVAATSLKIPIWLSSKAALELHEHGSADSRALTSFADSFKLGEYSSRLQNEFPEIELIYETEFHAKNFSVHAAGAVITDEVISKFVAVDSRNDTIMADKNTAERLGLLKLDLLGLKQLSVFARTLELMGVDQTNAFLDQIPMDDQEAFDIINQKKYSGIFQIGRALINLFKHIAVNKLEDIVAVTSLARPGPLSSGGANRWVQRRIGVSDIEYAHPCLIPILQPTFGEVVYQEQLMQIAKDIGGMSIEDVTALRKAVAKSKGAEVLRPFGDKFKLGAARFGFVGAEVDSFWDDLCGFGAYSFNRCIDGETLIERDAANRHCNKHETIENLYRLQCERRANIRQKSAWRNKGVRLISLFEKKQRGFANDAVEIIKNGKKDCYKYSFDDGSFVICTKEHRFLVNGIWREIQQSNVGDEFTCIRVKRGEIGRVVYFKKLATIEHAGMRETYDIEMNEHHNYQLSNGLVTHNSHAVAYSITTYHCCWLKAFYPVEFAAATLDAETDTEAQITLLRELHAEGVGYVPIDPVISTDRWVIMNNADGKKVVVGPLTSIKGIGPAGLKEILESRASGIPLKPGLAKKLAEAITPIDSLTPVLTALQRVIPDLTTVNIHSKPVPIVQIEAGDRGSVLIIGLLKGIKKKDRNDAESLQRRNGRRIKGDCIALNLTIEDDSGGDILCIIDPADYASAAPAIIERGGVDKAIYAIKGTVPDKFRMLSIQGVRYLCNIDDGLRPMENDWFGPQPKEKKEDFFGARPEAECKSTDTPLVEPSASAESDAPSVAMSQ